MYAWYEISVSCIQFFNGALNVSEYVASSDRMMSE
jgi:hypothetical protein